MKILAILCAWQRPEVTRLCYRALSRVKPPAGVELEVLVCGSEGNISRDMAWEFGFYYIEHPNRTVGAKHNALVASTRELEWDYLWLLGSDTLVTPNILALYHPYLQVRPARVGLRDLYFFDGRTSRLWYWPGYGAHRQDSIGAGRMFSRAAIERVSYEPWNKDLNRGLDRSSSGRFNLKGIREEHFRFRGHCMCDQGHRVAIDLDCLRPSPEYMLELRTALQITDLDYFFKPGREAAPIAVEAPPSVAELLADSPWEITSSPLSDRAP